MLILSLTMVSAASVSNIQTNYDKKTDKIFVEYDLTLNNECFGSTVNILDNKSNLIATNIKPYIPGGAITISCITKNGIVLWGGRTGTFHMSYELDTIAKRDIKGLGNLRYEITGGTPRELLAIGKI